MDGISDSAQTLIDIAIGEDVGSGDITSRALIDESLVAHANIIGRESLIVCGQAIAQEVAKRIDPELQYRKHVPDGRRVEEGEVVAQLEGRYRSILTAERLMLNFLQRLSGISTGVRDVVDRVSAFGVKVLDTRKTTPGWRELEKYAVLTGGGTNHRMGLHDMVLIKNNHIDAFGGGVDEAVRAARREAGESIRVEVEVRDQRELEEALCGQPDIILLDNMSPKELRAAVDFVRKWSESKGFRPALEASGGITTENVIDVAETGVDAISMGSLTHSARAADLALRFLKVQTTS